MIVKDLEMMVRKELVIELWPVGDTMRAYRVANSSNIRKLGEDINLLWSSGFHFVKYYWDWVQEDNL